MVAAKAPLLASAMAALDMVADGVIGLSVSGDIVYVNSAGATLLGMAPEELLGRRFDYLVKLEPDRASSYVLDAGTLPQKELFHPDAKAQVLVLGNRRLPVEVLELPANPLDLKMARMLVLHDRTREMNLRKSIADQARNDKLTGLLNRHELDRCLANLIEDAETANHTHAMLYIDLDQFKVINDTCGHMAGDELLRQLGMQLDKTVQHSDMVGRLGGDEFGVLLCNVDAHEAMEVAERICRTIGAIQFAWAGNSFAVGASIGVTMINEYTRTSEVAMRQVDSACYAAKELGRNRVHLYSDSDRQVAKRHGEMQWLSRIHQALDENRMRIVSQRIAPIQGGDTMDMAEVLMRIEAADGAMIAPGAFIPAAERYNLMPSLDRWVIRKTLDVLATESTAFNRIERYTINLSGLSIGDPKFLQFILDEFDRSGVAPTRVCFEVTETAAVASFSRAVRFMSLLREIGCQFALDDFGSGMSSFGYLRELPVDYLKIDGMFVSGLEIDPFHRAIVRSITEVDHAAGMKTIAEHVDSEGALRLLREMGVDYVQGFFIERPTPFGTISQAA